jgi:hypothetical protein
MRGATNAFELEVTTEDFRNKHFLTLTIVFLLNYSSSIFIPHCGYKLLVLGLQNTCVNLGTVLGIKLNDHVKSNCGISTPSSHVASHVAT